MSGGAYRVEVYAVAPDLAAVAVRRRNEDGLYVVGFRVGETRSERRLRRLIKKAQRKVDHLNAGLAEADRMIAYGEHLARTGQEKRR